MATEQGYKYYSKEEIDETFYNKTDIDTAFGALLAAEDVQFTLQRLDAGPYTTTAAGKRIHLGGNVYAYLCKATASGTGFTIASAGDKHFSVTFPTAFTEVYGGALNAALSRNTDCYVGNANISNGSANFWITSDSDGGDINVNFICIGEIDND